MGTVNRSIQSDYDRDMAAKLVANRPYPFTLTITDGKHRSTAQNRLQHMWMKEISEQKGDITAAEARAYCKLTIGVPILREQNEAFRLRYDEILKPLSYEQKLAIMSEPLNLPVTSLMSTKQLTEYLEGIIRHFGQQGIVLTMPDDMREELNTNSDDTLSTASSSDDAGNPPVDEAGADDVPASDAPASNLSRDQKWLLNTARMLWGATKAGGDPEVFKNQRLAAMDQFPKPVACDKRISEKANSVSRHCREIIDGALDPEDGLAVIAGIVGVDQDEILRQAGAA